MAERRLLPREHGFWVMLAAVLLGSVLRAPESAWVWAVALVTLVGAALSGGLLSRVIRKNETAQLLSTVALALASLPVNLAAGESLVAATITALAWALVFTSAALVVRAMFARASRHHSQRLALGYVAIVVPLLGAVAFVVAGRYPHAAASLLAALGALAFQLWKPSVKQLKPVGFALSGVVSVCAGVLAL